MMGNAVYNVDELRDVKWISFCGGASLDFYEECLRVERVN
jgi:hypothetical protein